MARHSSLKMLNDNTDRWSIVVRVFRKWNVYQKTSPSELFCISMVLIDEEGVKIQASVLNKSLHEKFRLSITEGQTYLFANFVVTSNVNQYRATNHPFKITFTPKTHIKQQAAALPAYSYSFMPIAEIIKVDQDHQVDYLIDVLAFVSRMGTLEEFRKDNETKSKLRMVLIDADQQDVECVLFDACATDAFMAQLQNCESPVVILLNLARVGFSEDGLPTVYSSFNATRVAFNPPIKEVKNFIESAKDRFSPVMSTMSQPMPSQSTQMSSGSSMHNQRKITISQIPDQEIGSYFVLNCEIHKLETRFDWNYDGCSKCGTKAIEENASLVCPSCPRRAQTKIEPKLKLHYLVKDQTGTVSIIFWDKLAVQLVQKTATELKLLLEQDEREYDFPDELDHPIGKNVLLKLKINEYNKKHPTSSISVGAYTICEDLMNQFMEATAETNADDGIAVEEEVDSTIEVTGAHPDGQQGISNPVVNLRTQERLDTQESNTTDLSKHGSTNSIKGKRRTNVKRHAVRDDPATSSQIPAVTPIEERINKVIKQEK